VTPSLLLQEGNPAHGGIHDIRDSLKRVEIGAILNPGELLKTADVLRAVRNLKSYASNDRIKTDEDNIVSELIGCLESNKRIEDRITCQY